MRFKTKEDQEVKVFWAVLCIALLLFILGLSSCSPREYGRETWEESEDLYEQIVCKIGKDSLNIRLHDGGLLKVYPSEGGGLDITAEHTKETIYLDRHYGSIFVYMYLRHRHISFEELANQILERAYEENVKFY